MTPRTKRQGRLPLSPYSPGCRQHTQQIRPAGCRASEAYTPPSCADSSPHDYSALTATPSVVPTGVVHSHPTRGWSGPVTRLVLMTRRSQTETAPLLVCSVLPNSGECCTPYTHAPTLTVVAVK